MSASPSVHEDDSWDVDTEDDHSWALDSHEDAALAAAAEVADLWTRPLDQTSYSCRVVARSQVRTCHGMDHKPVRGRKRRQEKKSVRMLLFL